VGGLGGKRFLWSLYGPGNSRKSRLLAAPSHAGFQSIDCGVKREKIEEDWRNERGEASWKDSSESGDEK